jgi:hypothetical protein
MAKVIGRNHFNENEWHFDESDFEEAHEDIALLRKVRNDAQKIDKSLFDLASFFDRCAPNCVEFEDHWSDFDEALCDARAAFAKAIAEMSRSINRAQGEPLDMAKERIAAEWMDGERFNVRGE